MLQRFPLIVAPTAGGKSELAVRLALELATRGITQAEIITADSMQVYRGMDIGTAKPSVAERRGVPHHLIDLVEPDDPEPFTVDRWLELAEACIADVRARGRLPIVVGGTNLYVKALLEGLFEGPGANPELRASLAALSREELRRRLESLDPLAAARIHPNDLRRTIRALEVHEATGKPISEHHEQWDAGRVRPDAHLIGLEWPNEAISRRINARVRDMVERGLEQEVRTLWEAGKLGSQAREALGYKQLIAHFEGRAGLEEAIEAIKIETRRFAKNQRTWLRRLRVTPGSAWFPISEEGADQSMQTIVLQEVMRINRGGCASQESMKR